MLNVLGNETLLGPAQWHAEPQFRGTFSVLSSCLTTLFLCTWTAVHLNIPEHGKEREQWWLRIKWLIYCVLAPDVVAWNAWEQRREAKRLTEDVAMLYEEHQISQGGGVWTDVHSWYVVMGGIVFESKADPPYFPDGRTRMTLTPEGLYKVLARWPELMPNLTIEDIQAKSKSDGLGKILTCVQAIWFCIQCISRIAGAQAISLLELSVFGHALCCLLTFAFWWHKPKDITHPTIISDNTHKGVVAYLSHAEWVTWQDSSGELCYEYWYLAGTQIDDARGDAHDDGKDICNPLDVPIQDLIWPRGLAIGGQRWCITRCKETHWNWAAYPGSLDSIRAASIPERSHTRTSVADVERNYQIRPPELERSGKTPYVNMANADNIVSIRSEQDELSRHNARRERVTASSRTSWEEMTNCTSTNIDIEVGSNDQCSSPDKNDVVTIDRYTQGRLYWMGKSLQLESMSDSNERRLRGQWTTVCMPDLLIDFNSILDLANVAPYDQEQTRNRIRAYRVFSATLANFLYGGIHAVAWTAPFPSRTEQNLWRAACGTVVFAIPGVFIFDLLASPLRALLDVGANALGATVAHIIHAMVDQSNDGIVICLGVWYCLCRAYLVVECFIALAYLSPATLATPSWTQYIPHIT